MPQTWFWALLSSKDSHCIQSTDTCLPCQASFLDKIHEKEIDFVRQVWETIQADRTLFTEPFRCAIMLYVL